MKKISIIKRPLHSADHDSDLRQKTPAELIGMMWQLALNAWSFKENLNVEPLNPDFKDMLSCLKDEKVDFLMVGALSSRKKRL
jgi:hypothetical protein